MYKDSLDLPHSLNKLSVLPPILIITSSLNGEAVFDAIIHADVIRRSHSGGKAMPPAFLDIVAAFALFRRSAINLLISWHCSTTLDFDL